MSRISPEWEAVRKTAAAGSTPERGSTEGDVLTLWTGLHGLLDECEDVGADRLVALNIGVPGNWHWPGQPDRPGDGRTRWDDQNQNPYSERVRDFVRPARRDSPRPQPRRGRLT
jgi:hypothetical protein